MKELEHERDKLITHRKNFHTDNITPLDKSVKSEPEDFRRQWRHSDFHHGYDGETVMILDTTVDVLVHPSNFSFRTTQKGSFIETDYTFLG